MQNPLIAPRTHRGTDRSRSEDAALATDHRRTGVVVRAGAIAALVALLWAANGIGETARAEASSTETPAARMATDFTLRDLDGKEHRLSSYLEQGKTVVLEWFNPDCPFVKKHHLANKTMHDLAGTYRDRNVVWLAINSGAPGLQGHGLERNRTARKEYKIDYPLLLDESGQVGRAYGAKTTPHMYVIAPDRRVLYAGAIDSEKNPAKLGETNYVRAALEAVLSGQPVVPADTAPYGCSVKYAAP